MLHNSQEKYGLISRLLHWLMAATILFMIGLGMYMTSLEKTDIMRPQLYGLHKSIGVTLLLLAGIRILWLMISPPPSPLQILKKFEVIIAKSVIGVLYLLMLVIPSTGYLMSNAFEKPINFFGIIELPQLIASDVAVGKFLSEVHETSAFLMLTLVMLHIAGALKHRLLILQRMI